jgi:y4mF family transcriptional regulator
METTSNLSAFVKYYREQAGLTQEQLANKAGVGIRFVRDVEQGKETLRLDKINQLLSLFGYEMRAEKRSVDPYEIWMNYFNKGVLIVLKNKETRYGVIIKEVKDMDQKIVAWEFISNKDMIEYQQTNNSKLKNIIKNADIASIELQKK